MDDKLKEILRETIADNQFIDGDNYWLTDKMLEEPITKLKQLFMSEPQPYGDDEAWRPE